MTAHVTVALLTYERTEYAVRTVRAINERLRYPNWHWYLADDGSRAEHVDAVMAAMSEAQGGRWFTTQSLRHSYGASANRALAQAFQDGDLLLMVEDDWELSRPFDIWPYAALLVGNSDIGMVRTGYLNPGLNATLSAFQEGLFWELDDVRSRHHSSMAFAGHPALFHKRFFDAHGLYPEGWQPGETEIQMAWRVAQTQGPKIVWPADLGIRGPWEHIGTQQSYEWNGGVRLDQVDQLV